MSTMTEATPSLNLPPVEVVELAEPADLWREIAPRYRPVVIRGLVADWPAVAAARQGTRVLVDYLGALDSGAPVTVFRTEPELNGRFFYNAGVKGLNFTTHKAPLRELLRELLALAGRDPAPALYAGSVPTAQTLRDFARANPAPWAPAGAEPRIWIGNATTIAPHYDLAQNVACVVAGHRRFTLFPPDQARNLYIGPIERTPAGRPVSMVDLANPDLDRFPRFAEALKTAAVADLEPGDAIYVPPLWWHHVRAEGALNVLVNYWSAAIPSKSPFAAMMHAMYAIRELPEAERAAWRDWFDLYAFSSAPDQWRHVPEHALGVLGPPSPARDDLIRAYVAQALTRP